MRISTTKPGCAALLFLANTVAAQVPADEIRTRALAAWNANEAQAKDVLYSKEAWYDFAGHTTGMATMLTGPQEVHTLTPVFRSHFETVNGQPRYVMDGWADQPPLAQKYRDVNKRIDLGPNLLDRGAMVREFLGPARQISLNESKTDRGHGAYVLESRGPAAVAGGRGSPARCPSAMLATLYIDSVTFFPLRVDATVVQANTCAPDPGNQFNRPGATVQFREVKVIGRDHCGELHNIYAVDQAVLTSNLGEADGIKDSPGTIAERVFMLGPQYKGGTQRQVSLSSGFHFFVACGVLRTEETAPPPSDDLVETESYFPLEGLPITERELARERADASTGARSVPTVITRSTKLPDWSIGYSANFDWSAKGIDARRFEGSRIGVNGDYSLPSALKPATLEQGRTNAAELDKNSFILIDHVYRQLLIQRVQEAFGDERLTAGRMASLLLAISVTPETSMPGVALFHRDFTFVFSRRLSEWEKHVARAIWFANFFGDPPAVYPAPAKESPNAIKIREALREGCVSGDAAASAWIAKPGSAKLEIMPFTGSYSEFILHLPPDFKLAQAVINDVQNRIQSGVVFYYDRDENNNIVGSSIFVAEVGQFADFVKSKYRGESCRGAR